MIELTFTVNGKQVSLEVDPTMPLLWLLRDELGLVGTKYGCGGGFCGACTVHINGVAVRSCQLPVGGLQQQAVTTIEGLGAAGLHALQQAWIDHDVPQCGYCQAGQIMAAASLLQANPAPDAAAIKAGMTNLCRCGSYHRIAAAIASAAQNLAYDAAADAEVSA